MKAELDPDVLEQTFSQDIKKIEDEDKEGIDMLKEEEDKLSNEKIKMKKTQLIFFYLKTAKRGMLSFLINAKTESMWHIAHSTLLLELSHHPSHIHVKMRRNSLVRKS